MKTRLKKTLKKIGILAYMSVAALTFMTSCQDFNIDTQPDRPLNIQIDAMDEYAVLATAPGSIVFNVSANTPWTIASDASWLSASPAMSASRALVSEIIVSVQANTDGTARTGRLTVSAEGLTSTKVITVRQASKENLLVVRPSDEVPTEGGEVTFTVLSNKAWEVIPSEQFVANIDKTSGEDSDEAVSETITVTIPANPGIKRTGVITVKTAFETVSFDITQKGYYIQRADNPEATALTISRWITTLPIIPIAANVEWNVEIPAEYASWLLAEAVSQTELRVSVSSNLKTFGAGSFTLKPKYIPDADGVAFTVNQSGLVNYGDPLSEADGTQDPATGYMTLTASPAAGTVTARFLTDYNALRPCGGTWTFTFESITMAANDVLMLGMFNPTSGYGVNLYFRPNHATSPFLLNTFIQNPTFSWSLAQTLAIRKVEIYIGSNTAPYPVTLTIDGVKIIDIVLPAGNGWPASWCGGVTVTNNSSTSSVVVKSLTYEPL
jgi:hypothetical protein